MRRPSPAERSYPAPDTTFGFQSAGWGIHSSFGKKTGLETMMQPMRWAGPWLAWAYRATRLAIASRLGAPFFSPKASQASRTVAASYRAKIPKPPMALCGAFSLKKNGVPGGELKPCAEGCQKFTSSRGWRPPRKVNQSWSVVATYPRTWAWYPAPAPFSYQRPRG